MSFSEFIFFVGFIQKTTEEDLNIKRDRRIISSQIHGKVLEDTRGLYAEGGDQTLPSGASQAPCAAQHPPLGSHHKLVEYSSTAS
jgi:hypothetical protein